jgi:hypothetical protein
MNASFNQGVCHETDCALIAVKSVDELLKGRCIERVRLALVYGQLIPPAIACFFFLGKQLARAGSAYEDTFGANGVSRAAARAGLFAVTLHGMT